MNKQNIDEMDNQKIKTIPNKSKLNENNNINENISLKEKSGKSTIEINNVILY